MSILCWLSMPCNTLLPMITSPLLTSNHGLSSDPMQLTALSSAACRRYEVVPALTGVFSKALAAGVSNVSFSDLSADLGRTMYEFKFRIPPYYTLLVRTLSVLEVGMLTQF